MKQNYHEIISIILDEAAQNNPRFLELYPGIELSFFSFCGKESLRFSHEPLAQVLAINYCISGRIGWDMGNGNHFYLGPGDFSLHTMDVCAHSNIAMPKGFYKGIVIYIDLKELSANPPSPLAGSNITGELLLEKYCKDGTCTALAGNETVQQVFKAFYQSPKEMRRAYQKIKVLELLLVLYSMEINREKHLTEYRSEQVEMIRQIHDRLISNLEQRCSIDSLSKQYLMNSTTLKSMFKAIYGTSIAAHIREHRMKNAAHLLQTSGLSIAEIALKVGYSSQSRFSSAFRNYFHILPKEYRHKYIK